ncbi:DUF2284 domain-containing protein [Velocimicrobium porci]|uniref:Metal-binding protein n=1 Tax=Velocimicrobium porci TaxID=2606634 RepID=A0A6L5Y1U9_9FIRM|nr:DUF2284 domain-containing protein [Velocimicrobium porci]MSS64972.1 hypothetical protein [Velocimicrobium porci]
MYQTETVVKKISVHQLFENYWKPDIWCEACKTCPYYGTLWSCPPGVPNAKEYLGEFSSVCLIGVKVIYDEETRKKSIGSEDRYRDLTYNKVRRTILETLLFMEEIEKNSLTVAAGRCEICKNCARKDGRPCIYPEKKRYSFSAFGFDITEIASKELKSPLLWSGNGLPEYDMAIAAYFVK